MGSDRTAMVTGLNVATDDVPQGDRENREVALARMVSRLNQYRSEDDVLRAVLADALSILGASSAIVRELDEERAEIITMGSIGVPSSALVDEFGRLPPDAPLPAIDAMRTGDVVIVRSAEERRQRYPLMDEASFAWNPAFVVAPMYGPEGAPFGTFSVGFKELAALEQVDKDLLCEVVTHSALALHRARQSAKAERNQEQLAFLDALSGALSRNLDVEVALTHLAELTVPRLADWCAVRVAEPMDRARAIVGVAHRDQSKLGHVQQLAGYLSPEKVPDSPFSQALTASRPLVRSESDPETMAAALGRPAARDALEAAGCSSLLVFPLMARTRMIGVLAFGNGPGRPLTQDDFDLAHATAVRAAVQVDNARLFAERSEVARALQDSLLPGVLPEIKGVELGARYRPAGEGLDVGGDFYDAFETQPDTWVFAVGDVCGHGVEAASLTGLARHTIRSVAMAGGMPSEVLRHLNRMLLQQSVEIAALQGEDSMVTPRFCTVLAGMVQRVEDSIDVVLCSAGHPLPLVRRANDTVEPVGVPGTLLGVTDDITLTDVMVHLAPGESLVCYTDGVTDRRRGRQSFGDEGVVATVLRGRGLSAPALADQVARDSVAFIDDEPSDDMAVLVLKARRF